MYFALAAALAVVSPAQGAETPAASPTSYDEAANWLCRPGRNDACATDLSSTVVAANGRMKPASFRPAKAPAVDCFYVYPTISLDTTPNSDLVPGPEEQAVIANQFARFGEVCRTFAPMYRQVTIPALRSGMTGKPMPGIDREVGYADVVAAWRHYLAKDNGGRGVILIGHSQGSGVLKRLIADHIDGKPDQARMIGAYLIGTNLLVPTGQALGGDFKSVPICTQRGEAGCAISYVTFRSTMPPPAQTRFGRTEAPGMQVACVNPAAIGSDAATPLKSYLGNRPSLASSQLPPKPWVAGKTVATPFVQTPGLLTGACTTEGTARYLKITVNGVPTDPRTDDISGDVINNGEVAADWGLHVIDVNVAMGDLLDTARAQSRTYLARR